MDKQTVVHSQNKMSYEARTTKWISQSEKST
jgi:hypothetical protein